MQNFNPIIVSNLALVITLIVFLNWTHAHVELDDAQFWEDPQDNLEIEFGYEPEVPVIDTFTNLEFSITDFRTGEHIEDSVAFVTITKGQRLYKFQNITVPKGDFSVDYLFPEDGTHQVLLRLDRNNSIHVASFQVFVPHQSPPYILANQGNLIIGIGIFAAVGAITILILKKK